MSDDNDPLSHDPDSDFFAKYILTCAHLGETPVSAERAADLIRQFTDEINRNVDPPTKLDWPAVGGTKTGPKGGDAQRRGNLDYDRFAVCCG